MPFYVKIETQTCGVLTAQCGGAKIAGRMSNTDISTGAGVDAALVKRFGFELTQAHDAMGGVGSSLAPFSHALTLYLPDYEPLITAAANALNKHDVITKLTLNSTRRLGDAKESKTQTYTMTNGLLTQMQHQVYDLLKPNQNSERGDVLLQFKFQSIEIDDHLAQTTGLIQTNSTAKAG